MDRSSIVLAASVSLLVAICGVHSLGNRNAVGSGVVCVVQNTNVLNANPIGCTPCVVNSAQALQNCIAQSLTSAGLTRYCSANTTNSTIPTNTCTFCTTAQVQTCAGATQITNNAQIPDAVFNCLVRTCSANPTVRFFGNLPVRKTDKIFAGFGTNNVPTTFGRRRRGDDRFVPGNRMDLLNKKDLGIDLIKDYYFVKNPDQKIGDLYYTFVADLDFWAVSDEIPVVTLELESE